MSHIIAADALLTSPVSESLPVPWDRDPALAALYDPFSLPLSASPPSTMPGTLPDTRKVLKGRSTPDAEQCLPTHQVFDFVPGSALGTPAMGSSPASTPASSPQSAPQALPQRSGSQHTFSAASGSEKTSSGAVVPAKRPSVAPPNGSSSSSTFRRGDEGLGMKSRGTDEIEGPRRNEGRGTGQRVDCAKRDANG